MGPRLRNIIGPQFKQAEAKMRQAYKTFVEIFNMETQEMINNSPVAANLSCPECSEEVHRAPRLKLF